MDKGASGWRGRPPARVIGRLLVNDRSGRGRHVRLALIPGRHSYRRPANRQVDQVSRTHGHGLVGQGVRIRPAAPFALSLLLSWKTGYPCYEDLLVRGEVLLNQSVDEDVATADPAQEDPLDGVVKEADVV